MDNIGIGINLVTPGLKRAADALEKLQATAAEQAGAAQLALSESLISGAIPAPPTVPTLSTLQARARSLFERYESGEYPSSMLVRDLIEIAAGLARMPPAYEIEESGPSPAALVDRARVLLDNAITKVSQSRDGQDINEASMYAHTAIDLARAVGAV